MVQTGPYRWQLQSPTGKVMVDDLQLADIVKAENWVKSYISSWNDWTFEIIKKENI